MSTSYKTSPLVQYDTIIAATPFDGISVAYAAEDHQPCLTDGVNFLRMYCGGDGNAYFERYGSNDVAAISRALVARFDVRMISEHDDDYEDDIEDEPESGIKN